MTQDDDMDETQGTQADDLVNKKPEDDDEHDPMFDPYRNEYIEH